MRVDSVLVDYSEFSALDPQRSRAQQAFVKLAKRDWKHQTSLLDIGAGPGPCAASRHIVGEGVPIDGVDVDPRVLDNADLREKWHSPFETATIPPQTYDFAVAYNVLEHIEHPQEFLKKLADVLRPGGIFWGYTPNGKHPFSLLSRSIELLAGKGTFAASNKSVNHYPSYYRLNGVRSVSKAARGLPFQQANFYHFYAPGWQNYFPRRLRWVPRTWDAVTRKRSTAVLAIRLQRSTDQL